MSESTTAPQNDEEALTLALYLAVTAPDDEKAKEATLIAEQLASTLDEVTVERCKRSALEMGAA